MDIGKNEGEIDAAEDLENLDLCNSDAASFFELNKKDMDSKSDQESHPQNQ